MKDERRLDDQGPATLPDRPEVDDLGDELADWFESLLPAGERKVLEAGCKGGARSLALALRRGFEVHILDSSETAIAAVQRRFEVSKLQGHFHLADPFVAGKSEFDLVFNAGVIQHYEFDDQVRLLRAMASRSKGRIAVVAPNGNCYWTWVSKVLNKTAGATPVTPVSDLRDVFAAAGIEMRDEKYLGRSWSAQFIRGLGGIDDKLKSLLDRIS